MSTLGQLLAAVTKADNKASVLRSQLAEADKVSRAAQEVLLEAMLEQGVDRVRNSELSVTIKEKSRPQVKDWESFYPIVSEYPHLLERRVSAKPFAELMEQRGGEPIPGVEIYTYEALQITRA